MMTDVKLQDAIDRFLDWLCRNENDAFQHSDAETCFDMLAEFLVYYSNLFQTEDEPEATSLDDWEEALEGYVEKLFDGDMEGSPDLGGLSLSILDAEYLRDFLGWYVLREPNASSLMVQTFSQVLQAWIVFMYEQQWLGCEQRDALYGLVEDVSITASEAAVAAHLLLYYVRLGAGVAPRLRGQRFDSFVEGHARIERLDAAQHTVFLGFDNQESPVIPIVLPLEIIHHLHQGDVLDVEMGHRGEQWIMVDIGPVYPASIYMEADELKIPDKLT